MYPFSKEFEYNTSIETLDLNKEAEAYLNAGKGFIVAPSQNIKKDLKNEYSIFSSKFGQNLSDVNTYINRYRCKCGATTSRIQHGIKCEICRTPVKFVDDDFDYFAWMKLDEPYKIIHPAYYKKLESFFGKGVSNSGTARTKIENIIDITDKKDINGYSIPENEIERPKDEPFFGIGMIQFIERFDEIIEFYRAKKYNKQEYYNDIIENREKIFISYIPVFTTLLRPFDIRDTKFNFEDSNGIYNIMNKHVTLINKNKTKMQREPKVKNRNLYRLQMNYMILYGLQEAILSGKKGDIRCLLGGRYSFSSRNVIVQKNLRIDHVTLPYAGLVILLEMRIKNILRKLYNISSADANDIWFKSIIDYDDRVAGIITSIINHYKQKGMAGIPLIINRNPTISYGSIVQVFCVDFTNTFTMGISTQILAPLVADFDGDVLNVLLILNKVFYERANLIFNPRNAMYISRNDGYFNNDVSIRRDNLINLNTFIRLGQDTYNQQELDNIQRLLQKQKEYMSMY